MLREKVTIEVDVEGEGLKKLTIDAKALRKALKGLDDASGKTNKKLDDQAELLERMRAALGPLGDVLGDITGGLDDTVTALDGFSKTQVAAAAGVVALFAGLAILGSTVVDVVSNLEDYTEAIEAATERKLIDEEDLENMKRAGAAFEALGTTFQTLKVRIASTFAPMFEDLARGTAALFGLIEGGWKGAQREAAAFNREQAKATKEIAKRMAEAKENTDEAKEAEKKRREAAKKAELAAKQAAAADKQLQAIIREEMLKTLGVHERQQVLLSERLAKLEELKRLNPALASQAEFIAEGYRAAIDELDILIEKSGKELPDAMVASSIGGQAVSAEFSRLFREGNEGIETLGKNATLSGEQAKAAIQDMATEAEASIGPYIDAISNTMHAIGGLYNMVVEQQTATLKQGSSEQRAALLKQFKTNKAFAIVNSVIQTAQAGLQALANTPYPANIVFAALATAAGMAQGAVIAAQQPPSFHRGGLLPDEQRSFNGQAITRQNEAGVVFTAQGQRSFTDAINAINRGDMRGGQGGITVMLDSQPIRGVVHQMGQADPAYGHRRRY